MKPIHAAALLYIDLEKDQILMVKKKGDSAAHKKRFGTLNYWTLPSGGIEEGETPLEAALRETKEETGIVVRQQDTEFLHKVGVYSKGQYPDFDCTVFMAEKTGGDILNPFVPMEAKKSKEILHTKWVDTAEAISLLPRIPSRPEHEPLLDYFKRGKEHDMYWVYLAHNHKEYTVFRSKFNFNL